MARNRKAILTGASSGIGEEMAYILSSKDYSLVLVARRKNNLERVKRKINVNCEYFVCDLSKEKDVEKLIQAHPDTDILINNAGYSAYGIFQRMGWQKQKDMIVVNSLAPARLCHHYLQGMIKRNYGKILNVASTAGSFPIPFISSYGAAKAFLIYLSEALALELKNKNVTVSCLLPGPTATEFWDVAGFAKKVKKARHNYDNPKGVALFGLHLLEKGIISGIPGWKNKLKRVIKSFMPRKILRNLIHNHMKHKSLYENK